MLLAQKLLPILQNNLKIYGCLTTILIKTGSNSSYFTTANATHSKMYLFKMWLSTAVVAYSYFLLLRSYKNLAFQNLIQTVFYQVAISFHIPILYKLYKYRSDIVLLFNGILQFEKNHNGKFTLDINALVYIVMP